MLYGRRAAGTVAYMGGLPAVLERFCWCWGQMLAFNEEFMADDQTYIHSTKANFSYHSSARNDLVDRFLGDWLVQLDTDQEFEPDVVYRLARLAELYKIDVLTGIYRQKGPPHIPVLYRWEEDTPAGLMPTPIVSWRPQLALADDQQLDIIEIGSAGGGCLFVRRNVFEKISRHYKCGPFDKIHPFSEDHSFFYRCRELGIECHAAVNVHANHLRVAPVTDKDFDPTYSEIREISQV